MSMINREHGTNVPEIVTAVVKAFEPAKARPTQNDDPVNHPAHYTDVVPGIECIDVTKHFPFLRGNAIKYLWRADRKGKKVEDLRKAIWYIQQEIRDLEIEK